VLSCNNKKEESGIDALTGHWIILYPDHHIKTRSERDVYGKYQDSIVNLFGLKLLNLNENGGFVEVDSLLKTSGKWMAENETFQIREGGKGFNPFKASVHGLENDTLQLLQYLPLENERIKVVWHLKKVDEDTVALKLFTPEMNEWRKKPSGPESEEALRKRLINMLLFYSDYLKLVSKESSYFLLSRVRLPFHYYQHAIGMREEMSAAFVNLFYDEDDAKKAYDLLQATIQLLKGRFQRDENFVVEYAQFFKRMAFYLKPI